MAEQQTQIKNEPSERDLLKQILEKVTNLESQLAGQGAAIAVIRRQVQTLWEENAAII